jgi:hypothetical protein
MVRVLTGLAAWAGGTALAVSLAWFGASVVVRNAGMTPGMPVVSAVTPPPPVGAGTPTPGVTMPAAASATPGASGVRHPAPRAATSPATPGTATPGTATPGTTTPGTTTPGTAVPATATPSATAGGARSYTLTGGRVTLLVTSGSVKLLTAVPDVGYSVQTWSETDWLRVDFSSGPQVSSLIASWYEHAPAITVTN